MSTKNYNLHSLQQLVTGLLQQKQVMEQAIVQVNRINAHYAATLKGATKPAFEGRTKKVATELNECVSAIDAIAQQVDQSKLLAEALDNALASAFERRGK